MSQKYTAAFVFFFMILLVGPDQLMAQRRVKGIPEALKKPLDLFENPSAYEKQLRNTDDKDKREAWLVMSDRDNNSVYNESSLSSGKVKSIQFKELFYVVDEKDDWIKIATASGVRKLKSKSIAPIGWVPKNKMLLWHSSLVSFGAKINKKAFFLNRADDVKSIIQRPQDFQLTVDFYRDPNAAKRVKERIISDCYFVFKKEGDMYLLSEESYLSAYTIESQLLGWVSAQRLQEWNTRVGIEPNFELKAYEERKANKGLHIKAFRKKSDIRDYVLTNNVSGVLWDNDPVKCSDSELAKTDYKRFKGSVFRFPLCGKGNGDTPFLRSGTMVAAKLLNDTDGITAGARGAELSLYTEIFLPLKVRGAQNPIYSYVLFMSDRDLLEYKVLIDRSISLISSESYLEKRKTLFEVYLGLIKQFAGYDFSVNPLDMTRKQVMEIMQGIEGLGLDLRLDLDVRIGDIRNEKKVSNEVIDQLIQRFNDVSNELERVRKISDRYDFCMMSDMGRRYYWLKINQVF